MNTNAQDQLLVNIHISEIPLVPKLRNIWYRNSRTKASRLSGPDQVAAAAASWRHHAPRTPPSSAGDRIVGGRPVLKVADGRQ
jgi:hypothetical protein